ncbi:MAG: transcriptional regulator MraZ [Thalassobaculales bacterium]
MKAFIGTFVNRLDSKGRVSVPAPFRSVLEAQGGGGRVVLVRSFKAARLDGYTTSFFDDQVLPSLYEQDLFSDESNDLAMTFLGEAEPLPLDDNGRIVLRESLMQHAGISDQVAFLGAGLSFQVWEPKALEAEKAAAFARARDNGLSFRPKPPAGA